MKNYNTFIKINENLKYMNILDKIHDKYIIEDNVYKILKLILFNIFIIILNKLF